MHIFICHCNALKLNAMRTLELQFIYLFFSLYKDLFKPVFSYTMTFFCTFFVLFSVLFLYCDILCVNSVSFSLAVWWKWPVIFNLRLDGFFFILFSFLFRCAMQWEPLTYSSFIFVVLFNKDFVKTCI